MSDLVEKVSRAIDPEWWHGWDVADESQRNWLINVQAHVFNLSRAKDVIIATLDAIREPSDAMIEAGQIELANDSDCQAFDKHYAGMWDTWRVMIDVKRKEIEEE